MRKHVAMLSVLVALVAVLGLVGLAGAQDQKPNPVVVIKTNMGVVKIELFADKMPETTKNFLSYVDEKFYDGLTFHRALPGTLIQGGQYGPKMQRKEGKTPVKAETNPDLKITRGSIGMIVKGTKEAPTISCQFTISLRDRAAATTPPFGKVIEGMDVVDKIGNVKTGESEGHDMVPVEPVVMESVARAETK